MKRNLKVIQINGFRGLFLTLFIISCLIAGFIAFPALLTMNLWNYLSLRTGTFPAISFYEGILLWAIIAFSIYIFNKRKLIVSFNSQHELSDDEVKDVISSFKSQSQSFNPTIMPHDEKNLQNSNEENSNDFQSNSQDEL